MKSFVIKHTVVKSLLGRDIVSVDVEGKVDETLEVVDKDSFEELLRQAEVMNKALGELARAFSKKGVSLQEKQVHEQASDAIEQYVQLRRRLKL